MARPAFGAWHTLTREVHSGAMAKIKYINISNYRSIGDTVTLRMPDDAPLVLVGPNNSGKSNIATAIELVLGERWPSNHEPQAHEFHNRNASVPIGISIDFEDLDYIGYRSTESATSLIWRHKGGETDFKAKLADGREYRPTTETREQCVSLYISPDRRLSHNLSYATRYTLLSRLMRRFHNALVSDGDRKERLQAKFHEVERIFSEVKEFNDFSKNLQRELESFSESIEYRLGVDFSAYDPSNYFHALHIQPKQGEEARSFDELGTGQEQLLTLSLVQAYAKAFHGDGLLLIIEEPEAHLHPLAQHWLAHKIKDLVDAGVQVIVTTHSPAFINILGAEGLVIVRKIGDGTSVTQLNRRKLAQHCANTGAPRSDANNILTFYAAAATPEIVSGLFARKVVLVEGLTEALALPDYYKQVGLDFLREGIAAIPVHGVGNIAKWWRFFTAYGIPTYATFDNDADKKSDPQGLKRKDILSALGVDPSLHGELMNATDWRVDAKFSVFGNDFETTLRDLFGDTYRDLEQQASEFGLDKRSKPLVARYVSEHIEVRQDSSAHEKFHDLCERIRAL